MEIDISKLSKVFKKVAKELDNEGNQNGKIDNKELSIFKATCAYMVNQFKASDLEYTSIFGESAFADLTQTKPYELNQKEGLSYTEYTDKKGNIIRGSVDKDGINVYLEEKNGCTGYYSESMIMIPDGDCDK